MNKIGKKQMTWETVLSYRNEIFGLAAIWIVLFHMEINVGFSLSGRLASVIRLGNLGVDIFLFLSAIGLYKSYSKNDLSTFLKHRIVRVIIPYLLVSVLYFFWYDFVFLKDGIIQYLMNVTTLNFWLTGDHPTWYVAFIIIAYAVYPVLYEVDVKTRHVGTILLIIISVIVELILWQTENVIYLNCERALSRVPIFLFGVLAAEYIWKKSEIRKVVLYGSVLLGSIIGIVLIKFNLFIIVNRYLFGIVGIAIIITYAFLRTQCNLFKYIGELLSKAGNVSLEIYVVHVFLIRILGYYDCWNNFPSWVWYCGMLVCSFFGAYAVSGITGRKKSGLKIFSKIN